MRQDIRIGIDVGGTFTDFVLFEPQKSRFAFHKQQSTPEDPARAVAEGLIQLLKNNALQPENIGLIVHGTTIGLNALLQRRSAPQALVVTRGFRDMLNIGRARLPSSFDFQAACETPLVPREQVLELNARFTPEGEISLWPDDNEFDSLAESIRGLQVEAVTISTLNGYANPEQEQKLADALASRLDGISIQSAATLWPEIREYERTLLACLNSGIQPLMTRYFDRLTSRFSDAGIDAPLLISASNGGVIPLVSARQRPVETLLSGPASGAIGAARLVEKAGGGGFISFDMGGTSSDISLSAHGDVERVARTDIGGYPLILPVVGIFALGAGGGSLVQMDRWGVLKVGPESAGGHPGPVAYDQGGQIPAVTDCYLTCGLLDAERFLGGRMPLNAEKARQALANLAPQLGFSGEDAAAKVASGALSVATTQMATALNSALAQRGISAKGLTLVAFGGAGPTHANWLADEAGLERILVPPRPGTFCAQGAAETDLRRDVVRSLRITLTPESEPTLNHALEILQQQAQEWLAQEATGFGGEVSYGLEADLRYSGQAWEMTTPLSPEERLSASALSNAFHELHHQRYGFHDEDSAVELTTLRLSITAALPPLPPLRIAAPDVVPQAEQRTVWLNERWQQASVWQRTSLQAGQTLTGPALVEQDDTTIVVLGGWQATTDTQGNLLIERLPEGARP